MKDGYTYRLLSIFSQGQVVGWAMKPKMTVELVLMPLWRRQPKNSVLIHFDQGSQYTSHDWLSFLKAHDLVCSMSRRGNCHNNAVAESFFQLLKRERIKQKVYRNRDVAQQGIFNYIEMFYNPIRRHRHNGNLSSIEFEKKFVSNIAGV